MGLKSAYLFLYNTVLCASWWAGASAVAARLGMMLSLLASWRLAALCSSTPEHAEGPCPRASPSSYRGYVLFLTYKTTQAGGGLQDVWQVQFGVRHLCPVHGCSRALLAACRVLACLPRGQPQHADGGGVAAGLAGMAQRGRGCSSARDLSAYAASRAAAQAVELPLKAAQTAAILEVLHSAAGLVRSPVMITGGQLRARLPSAGYAYWGGTGAHRRR